MGAPADRRAHSGGMPARLLASCAALPAFPPAAAVVLRLHGSPVSCAPSTPRTSAPSPKVVPASAYTAAARSAKDISVPSTPKLRRREGVLGHTRRSRRGQQSGRSGGPARRRGVRSPAVWSLKAVAVLSRMLLRGRGGWLQGLAGAVWPEASPEDAGQVAHEEPPLQRQPRIEDDGRQQEAAGQSGRRGFHTAAKAPGGGVPEPVCRS